ncbi:MAG: putative sulfate exporter family transporter [Cohaesibacter sp.]|nr:putative sulfate exporter family transporter [Cohaesibacter sp.]
MFSSADLSVFSNHVVKRATDLWPGLSIAGVIAITASYLSEHHGGPVMLYALLIGMAFHFLSKDARCMAGLGFASKRLLRIGVALLGLRISFDQILLLGFETLLLILFAVLGCLFAGLVIARFLKKDLAFGLLTGGAVGICGASAALAISSVLPKDESTEKRIEHDTLFTVIAVTSLSTIAMVLYPTLGSLLGLSDQQIGIMLGATIHDVAQVVGAGYGVSDEAGDVATIVKLVRVMMLLPVMVLVAVIMGYLCRQAKKNIDQKNTDQANQDCQSSLSDPAESGITSAQIPFFAFGFVFCVLLNSCGWVPEFAHHALVDASRWSLVIAISALGVMTTLQSIVALGAKHLFVVVLETLLLLGGVILALYFLF